MDSFYPMQCFNYDCKLKKDDCWAACKSDVDFVLYGMTPCHIRDNNRHHSNRDWHTPESHGISTAIIERYLQKCGRYLRVLPHGTAIQLHTSTTFASRFPSFRKNSSL